MANPYLAVDKKPTHSFVATQALEYRKDVGVIDEG